MCVSVDNNQVLQSDLVWTHKWPFQSLSDLHLGDQKVTLKKLEDDTSLLEGNKSPHAFQPWLFTRLYQTYSQFKSNHIAQIWAIYYKSLPWIKATLLPLEHAPRRIQGRTQRSKCLTWPPHWGGEITEAISLAPWIKAILGRIPLQSLPFGVTNRR